MADTAEVAGAGDSALAAIVSLPLIDGVPAALAPAAAGAVQGADAALPGADGGGSAQEGGGMATHQQGSGSESESRGRLYDMGQTDIIEEVRDRHAAGPAEGSGGAANRDNEGVGSDIVSKLNEDIKHLSGLESPMVRTQPLPAFGQLGSRGSIGVSFGAGHVLPQAAIPPAAASGPLLSPPPPAGDVPAHVTNGSGASHRPDDGQRRQVPSISNAKIQELCKVSCHAAAMYGDVPSLEKLINAQTREETDKVGLTPLHFAACYGQQQALEWLVGQGSDIDAKSDLHWTCLHVASRNGHLGCVELLVETGADVNAMDVNKWTPLHNACCSSSLETVDKLLAAGAKTDVRDKDGWTPLHFAARFNNVEMLDSLLAAGADVNVQDVDGWTPIHNSARNGRNRCVTKLLENGASLQVTTRWEETPLHVACRKGKAKIVAEMVQHAKTCGGQPSGELYRSLLASKDKEGRTPEELSSSEHIRCILRGECIETGYELTGPASAVNSMMTLPRAGSLKNFSTTSVSGNVNKAVSASSSKACTIL